MTVSHAECGIGTEHIHVPLSFYIFNPNAFRPRNDDRQRLVDTCTELLVVLYDALVAVCVVIALPPVDLIVINLCPLQSSAVIDVHTLPLREHVQGCNTGIAVSVARSFRAAKKQSEFRHLSCLR